jgi:hypothetical protein
MPIWVSLSRPGLHPGPIFFSFDLRIYFFCVDACCKMAAHATKGGQDGFAEFCMHGCFFGGCRVR